MQMNALGRSGLKVSRLCFGTLTMSPLQRDMTPEEGALLLRAAAIAPSCFLYGVVSGVFYSRSRVYALAGEKEKELLEGY